jgi:hypothetical protein
MTSAQRRALEAVKAGKCERRYTATGNTMHGAHAATLWACLRNGWIRDGKLDVHFRCRLELTLAGEAELAKASA